MSEQLTALQEAIEAVSEAIHGVVAAQEDFAGDFAAAITALQEQIAAGNVDLGPSVAALVALKDKALEVSASIAALDAQAETISGQPTPPPVA